MDELMADYAIRRSDDAKAQLAMLEQVTNPHPHPNPNPTLTLTLNLTLTLALTLTPHPHPNLLEQVLGSLRFNMAHAEVSQSEKVATWKEKIDGLGASP